MSTKAVCFKFWIGSGLKSGSPLILPQPWVCDWICWTDYRDYNGKYIKCIIVYKLSLRVTKSNKSFIEKNILYVLVNVWDSLPVIHNNISVFLICIDQLNQML